MTGFDKWTSEATPEKIAGMIARLPPTACLLVCPLSNGCKWPMIGNGEDCWDCYKAIKQFFDKEIKDERDN